MAPPTINEIVLSNTRSLETLESDLAAIKEALSKQGLSHDAILVQHEQFTPLLGEYKGCRDVLSQYIDGEAWELLKKRYETFNASYLQLLTRINEYMTKHNGAQVKASPNDSTMQADVSMSFSKHSALKTPKIDTPEYDGTPEKWLKFRDLFESMIHAGDYPDIVKFQYLETALKKIPLHENPLCDFSVKSDSYADAWNAVCKRYNDTRKILALHLDKLFGIEAMKAESAKEIRNIVDSITTHLSALKQCGFVLEEKDNLANLLIVHIATSKLEPETLKDWRKFHDEDTATWKELHDFLVAQWRSVDDIRAKKKVPKQQPTVETKNSKFKTFSAETSSSKTSNSQTLSSSSSKQSCVLCGNSHSIWACELSPQDKFKVARDKGLCLNCLNGNHKHKECPSKGRCKSCGKPHHSLLHFPTRESNSDENQQSTKVSQSSLSSNAPSFKPYTMVKTVKTNNAIEDWNQANTVVTMTSSNVNGPRQAILSTASVGVMAADGFMYSCRALLDSGSDSNFMSTALANHLKLELHSVCVPVVGINQKTSMIRYKTSTTIASHYGPYQKSLQFNVMQRLTGNIPSQSMDAKHFKDIPINCVLADPQFNTMSDVDLLLNADVFFDSLLPGKMVLQSGVILLHSTFGWIVGGSVPLPSTTLLSSVSNNATTGYEEIDQKLDAFFRADEVLQPKKLLTAEEKFCEKLFKETTTRDADGRFVVFMPFKEDFNKLGTNLKNSTRQAFMQETRRKKDRVYNQLYSEYMKTYIDSKYMSEIDPNTTAFRHYVPHHGVVKMSSTTTKLRPVFNASCKSETGLSLNDVLCVGPTVQPESFDILLRFREKRFAMIGDLEKMYLRILIHLSQRHFLCLVWREDINAPLTHYNMNSVTFGTACASYLATRCVKQLAIDFRDKYPKACNIIESSFYVDDLLANFDDITEALTLRDQIREILKSAGMMLRKFSANHLALLVDLPEEDKMPFNTNNTTIKTLGIQYSANLDQFSYSLKPMKTGKITKASVLSEIASIFDPIGWLGPVILEAKLFMKLLWQYQLSWTDELPDDLQEQWNLFREKFHLLNNIKINRHCVLVNNIRVEVHAFCDASIEAYGAVIYALSYDSLGNHQVSLLCSKSRVAPIRQKSLPRLELCGATLVAKLNTRILEILTINIHSVTLWSDSSIVLCWITMESSRLMTYVGNRVSQIQENSHQHTWKHIEGSQNPADLISRGLEPADLQDCALWWNGPPFFALPQSSWPTSIITINERDPQVLEEVKKSSFVSKTNINSLFVLIETRFSKLSTLINVLVFIRRFIHNTKHKNRLSGSPSIAENKEALMSAVKIIQQQFYSQEYSILRKSRRSADDNNLTHTSIPRNSSLLALTPFMDEEGILRVSGRVCASASLSDHQKHQIILPSCHLALLIVRDIHKKNLHPGASAMKSFIRQQFWIVKSRDVINRAARECLICFRAKPKVTNQLMSNLPAERVNMTSPFENTALDYAGFYTIKSGTTRNAPKVKAYIALFKCMCSGAIHLEVVSDLSTNAFISAFDRFVSRRGICKTIFCDNATAFHGADNELKKIIESLTPDIKQHLIDHQTRFQFTTPRASHAGGIYESGIKSMKHYLKRVLDERSLTFEQFATVLCKIEALLNSRPLSSISEDPKDLEVLTPGHFLIFRPLNARPERSFIEHNSNQLDRWKIVQQIQQQFWKLWYHDYIHLLQTRPNNFRQKFEFRVGDLVLIKDSNLPPMKWLVGRLIKLFPGKDGVIRNVRVITKTGEKDRHVKYLCFLPTNPSSTSPESVFP